MGKTFRDLPDMAKDITQAILELRRQEGGSALPAGGTTGQLLAKASDEDFNAGWIDPPSGSSGGSSATGFSYRGTVPAYADLPAQADVGDAYMALEDGRLYIYGEDGFPANGEGLPFRGPPGADGEKGEPGPQGPPGGPPLKNVVDTLPSEPHSDTAYFLTQPQDAQNPQPDLDAAGNGPEGYLKNAPGAFDPSASVIPDSGGAPGLWLYAAQYGVLGAAISTAAQLSQANAITVPFTADSGGDRHVLALLAGASWPLEVQALYLYPGNPVSITVDGNVVELRGGLWQDLYGSALPTPDGLLSLNGFSPALQAFAAAVMSAQPPKVQLQPGAVAFRDGAWEPLEGLGAAGQERTDGTLRRRALVEGKDYTQTGGLLDPFDETYFLGGNVDDLTVANILSVSKAYEAVISLAKPLEALERLDVRLSGTTRFLDKAIPLSVAINNITSRTSGPVWTNAAGNALFGEELGMESKDMQFQLRLLFGLSWDGPNLRIRVPLHTLEWFSQHEKEDEFTDVSIAGVEKTEIIEA